MTIMDRLFKCLLDIQHQEELWYHEGNIDIEAFHDAVKALRLVLYELRDYCCSLPSEAIQSEPCE